MEPDILMYFDGSSKGNPGPSGAAYVVNNGLISYEGYKFLGIQTNNEAEYNGLILGLKSLLEYKERVVKIYGDSNLVIEQMKGNWQIKAQ